MKLTIVLLLISLNIFGQQDEFTSKFEMHADSIFLYAGENINCNFEGNELHWYTDHSKKNILYFAIVQYPLLMIYFADDKNISKVVVHKTLLLRYGQEQFLLLPGEYRIRKNDLYQYIICKSVAIAAYDSSPVLSAHVCFRPW